MKIKSFLSMFTTLFVVLLFIACAGTEPSAPEGVETEIWRLELTDQTRGTLEMTLWRQENQPGVHVTGGKISGKIEDHLGGAGQISITFKGSITDGVFKASLSGKSKLTEGPSPVTGTIQGNLSDSKGSGTYRTKHKLGTSKGGYTMIKE